MAARPYDLSIIWEYPAIPKAWGTFVWSFPSICSAVSEKKIFEGKQTKKSLWLKNNHMTDEYLQWIVSPKWDRHSSPDGDGRSQGVLGDEVNFHFNSMENYHEQSTRLPGDLVSSV